MQAKKRVNLRVARFQEVLNRCWGNAFLHSNKPNQRIFLGIYDPKSIPPPRDVSQARFLASMGNNWHGSRSGGGWCHFSMVLPHLDAILSQIYKNKSNRVRQSDAIFGVMVLLMIALLFILLVVVMLKIYLNSIISM